MTFQLFSGGPQLDHKMDVMYIVTGDCSALGCRSSITLRMPTVHRITDSEADEDLSANTGT